MGNTSMQKVPCAWFRGFDIIKMSLLSKLIYRFNVTPIKMLPLRGGGGG